MSSAASSPRATCFLTKVQPPRIAEREPSGLPFRNSYPLPGEKSALLPRPPQRLSKEEQRAAEDERRTGERDLEVGASTGAGLRSRSRRTRRRARRARRRRRR